MLAGRSRALPLSNDLYSPSLPSSSSFLKSFVFWARSLRWASESLWWATISVAATSCLEIVFERSISARPFSTWISCRGRTPIHTSPNGDRLLKFILILSRPLRFQNLSDSRRALFVIVNLRSDHKVHLDQSNPIGDYACLVSLISGISCLGELVEGGTANCSWIDTRGQAQGTSRRRKTISKNHRFPPPR